MKNKIKKFLVKGNLSNQDNCKSAGITLIALVITIIVLIILAGVTLNMLLGEHGIISRTKIAKEENEKATATETMNLKITNVQISKYAEEQRMPTLKELADNFCEDIDFEYVQETSKVASLKKINNENPNYIFVKLKKNIYEFKINDKLKIEKIKNLKTNEEEQIIEPDKYEVTIQAGDEIVSVNGGGYYQAGDTVTIIATPRENEIIVGTEEEKYYETTYTGYYRTTNYIRTYTIENMSSTPDCLGTQSGNTYTFKMPTNNVSIDITTTYNDSIKDYNQGESFNEAPVLSVTTSDIGKLVNGYVASGATALQWRVFWVDTDYIYIISTGIEEEKYEPHKYTTTIRPTNPIWNKYCTTWDTNWNTENLNQTSGAYLMTEENWTKYKDSTGNADYAVGTIPFEMYIASINNTQSKGWNYTWSDYGYKLSGSNIGTTGTYSNSGTIQNTMSSGIYNISGSGTWLAGPSTKGKNNLSLISNSMNNLTNIQLGGNPNETIGLRPLVAIPTSKFKYTLSQ